MMCCFLSLVSSLWVDSIRPFVLYVALMMCELFICFVMSFFMFRYVCVFRSLSSVLFIYVFSVFSYVFL